MQLEIEKLGKVSITVEKDAWDINKEYDRLVIVKPTNGNATYLSRKKVPSGIALTNTEYWIVLGSDPQFNDSFEYDDNGTITIKTITTQELNEMLNTNI